MKKIKHKLVKKAQLRWFYTGLFGVLLLLLAILIWSGYSEHEVRNISKPSMPVYEDIQLAPTPEVIVEPTPEPAALEPELVHKKEYQYGVLKQYGMALIIDDVGYDLHALQRILDLNMPVAISIIPEAPHAREAAEMAHKAGHIVMLHMPMEPANPHYRDKMDGSFLRGDMSEETVRLMLLKGLEKVPYVQGINNHMGSFLTSMPEPMSWVMRFCQEHGLFFIDSKTSPKSVAADIAVNYGLTWGARRVFLDHSVKEGDIKHAWLLAEHCAKQQAGCIVIGHPHPETLDFLEKKVTHVAPTMMRVVVDLLHAPQG